MHTFTFLVPLLREPGYLRRERQAAGIAVAKRKGRYHGRAKGSTKAQPALARILHERGFTVAEIQQPADQSAHRLPLSGPKGESVSCSQVERDVRVAQFIAICRRSKWSKHFTNSPLLALAAMTGSSAARTISSACSQAFC